MYLFLLFLIIHTSGCFRENFNIGTPLIPPAIQEFVIRVVQENNRQKLGFLFVQINVLEQDYADFCAKLIHQNLPMVNANFNYDNDISDKLDPQLFKFGLMNPEDDAAAAGEIFKKVKVSTARLVLILTKKPLPIIVDYILQAYWRENSLNIVIAYESNGDVEIVTYNPFLPKFSQRIQVLSKTDELFPEKTLNLHGININCLLTYQDRTKVKSKGLYYEGKDYVTLETLLTHLNAKMRIITMDNALFNPWFAAFDSDMGTTRKKHVLDKYKIGVLIKSEYFSVDDTVLDNLYPHTQNDLSSLVRKSSEIQMAFSIYRFIKVYIYWFVAFNTLFAVFLALFRKTLYGTMALQELYLEYLRIIINNILFKYPRHHVEKYLLHGWLLSAYFTNLLIQTKITSLLPFPEYYPEINTIGELFALELPLYTIPTHKIEIYKKYTGTQYEKYLDNLIGLPTSEGLLDKMLSRIDYNRFSVYITEHDMAVYLSQGRQYYENGVPVYHLVKESIIPNYQSYKVIHNSPLLPILNKKLRILGEAGFVELWSKRALFNDTLSGLLYPEGYMNIKHFRPLTLRRIQIWIYFIFLGYTASFVSFTLEMVWFKLNHPFPFVN